MNTAIYKSRKVPIATLLLLLVLLLMPLHVYAEPEGYRYDDLDFVMLVTIHYKVENSHNDDMSEDNSISLVTYAMDCDEKSRFLRRRL